MPAPAQPTVEQRPQGRVRTKICGLTRAEDVAAAVAAGVDALGFNFVPGSPRCLSADHAAGLVAGVPPYVTTVGLFVDADPASIEAVLRQVSLACLQFQGNESPEECARYGRPWLKALRMRPDLDADALVTIAAAFATAPGCCGIQLDAWSPDAAGGTGEVFDWSRIPATLPAPLILAGGLTPENVALAIEAVRPHAVDVAGGVEGPRKGEKDHGRIRAFINEVNRVRS